LEIKKNLIFIRHAESIGNTMNQDGRAALEIPNHAYSLTVVGCEQARLVGEFLGASYSIKNYYPHWVCEHFTSTFRRTQETWKWIQKGLKPEPQFDYDPLKIQPVQDSRLDEKWDGIFHELTKKEIENRYPEQLRLRKRAGYYHYRAPGGESCPDAELRIKSFIQEHLAEPFYPPGSPCYVMIIGHGRWFQIFQKIIHELSVEEFLTLKSTADNHPCAVTVYQASTYRSGLESIPQSIVPWKGKVQTSATELA
jgi:broad specificity phosphatase PhoE